MEYVIEGWGKSPFDELFRIQQLAGVKIISRNQKKEFLPILEGDTGEPATFTSITIQYEGSLW